MGAAACGHVFNYQEHNDTQSTEFDKWLSVFQKSSLNSMSDRKTVRKQFAIWLRACMFVTVVPTRVPNYYQHIVDFLHWTTGSCSEWINSRNIKTLLTIIPVEIKQSEWYYDKHYMHELEMYSIIIEQGLCASLIPNVTMCKYCTSTRLTMLKPTKLIYVHGNELLPGSHYRLQCNKCKRYYRYGSHVSNGKWIPDVERNELEHWLISSDSAVATDTLVDTCGNTFIFKAGSSTEERRRTCQIFSRNQKKKISEPKELLKKCGERMLENAKYYKQEINFEFHKDFNVLDQPISNKWNQYENDEKNEDSESKSQSKPTKYVRNKQSLQQMLIERKYLTRKLIQKARLGYMWHLMVQDLCRRTKMNVLHMLSIDLKGKKYPTIEMIVEHGLDKGVMNLYHDVWFQQHKQMKINIKGHGYVTMFDGNAKFKHTICANAAKAGSANTIVLVPELDMELKVGCLGDPFKDGLCKVCYKDGVKLPSNIAKKVYATRSTVKKRARVLNDLARFAPNIFFVRRIHKEKMSNGNKEMLVEWAGHTKKTWVSEDKLPEMVLKAHAQNKDVIWDCYSLEEMSETARKFAEQAKQEYTCNTQKDVTYKKKETPQLYNKSRTAGVQHGCCPCGIIMTLYENYRAETLTQQWAQCINLIKRYPEHDWTKERIGFDDVCHFDAMCQKKKNLLPGISDLLAKILKFIDAHHFPNHQNVNGKKRGCGTKYKHDRLDDLVGVNTEICESNFFWLSAWRNVVINMNGLRFKGLALCLAHFKNVDTMNRLESQGKWIH
eukprot:85580_1